jgi:hypothetical protein
LCRICYNQNVPIQTLTLKLPFLHLNKVKAAEWSRLERVNTDLANRILGMPKAERRRLTTASFADVELGSAWVNQTIRTVNKSQKVRAFKRLPLETNNQNWTLHKVGNTYSISFGLLRGVKKRVPLEVHQANHGAILEGILAGLPQAGAKQEGGLVRLYFGLLGSSQAHRNPPVYRGGQGTEPPGGSGHAGGPLAVLELRLGQAYPPPLRRQTAQAATEGQAQNAEAPGTEGIPHHPAHQPHHQQEAGGLRQGAWRRHPHGGLVGHPTIQTAAVYQGQSRPEPRLLA